MVEGTTTLPPEPDYLHELGLSEVARIKNGLEQIKQEVSFGDAQRVLRLHAHRRAVQAGEPRGVDAELL